MLRSSCECPVPCHFDIYDPSVSYSSISNQLVNKLLQSNASLKLKTKMRHAHETSTKMDLGKFQRFVSLVESFKANFESVREVADQISASLQDQWNQTEAVINEMSDVFATKERMYRYQEYAIDQNFLRGREAMEERVLANVANAYAEFAMQIKRRIERLASSTDDNQSRKDLYSLITDQLKVRQEIAKLARENISVLIGAYINGKKIFNYKFEDLPRSHNTYIVPKPLMNDSMHYNSYVQKYVPKLLNDDFDKFADVFEKFINLTNDAYENQNISDTYLNYVFERYQFVCRTYLFSKSVVYKYGIERPKTIIEERRAEFIREWAVFTSLSGQLEQIISSLKNQIEYINNVSVPDINGILSSLTKYSHNNSLTLFDLSEMFRKNDTQLMISTIKEFFQEVQTRGQSISDLLSLIESPTHNIWKTIIEDEDSWEYYTYTNNDLFLRNLSDVDKEWSTKLQDIKSKDIRMYTQNRAENFISAFTDLYAYLDDFENSIVINSDFVK